MKKTNIDFTGKFPMTSVFSVLLVISSLALFFTKGMVYGVDFRGGAEIQVKFKQDVAAKELRSSLSDAGFKGASVVSIGLPEDHEYLIKVKASNENLNKVSTEIAQTMTSKFADKGVEIRKTDIVGPKAGAELRNSGFQAMLWALLAIMIYVGLRFDFKYSPGAVVALFHDVLIIIGIFSLTNKEFTLQIVAALLAVIGYSVNDTVVVYDRVREHEEKYAGVNLKTHINKALNETLSRTLITSATTFFVAGSMFLFGGTTIHDFFFVISLGVIIGTYSSIFVAAPATLLVERLMNGSSVQGKAVKSS